MTTPGRDAGCRLKQVRHEQLTGVPVARLTTAGNRVYHGRNAVAGPPRGDRMLRRASFLPKPGRRGRTHRRPRRVCVVLRQQDPAAAGRRRRRRPS